MAAPVTVNEVDIDENCNGERWVANDLDELARLISIIAMGQVAQAGHILRQLIPATPAFSTSELVSEAKIRLTAQEKPTKPRQGYPRVQRDGFIFEAVSWIAARKAYGNSVCMKDPHTSATTQGLDGLMLELSNTKKSINRVTIFEDKCVEDPVFTFKREVMRAFQDRHSNKRCAEIVATATALLGKAGIDEGSAANLASAVTDLRKRRYRAAFAVTTKLDSKQHRSEIFAAYSKISDLNQDQRLGACLVVPPELRDWFEGLAERAVKYLETLDGANPDV